MIESEKDQFKKLLIAVYKMYDKTVDKNSMRLWWECLVEYDSSIIRKAFSHHLKTNKWMPRPAEIREIIKLAEDTKKIRQPRELPHKMTREQIQKGLDKLTIIKSNLKCLKKENMY
jgi:hypothetical protein